MSGKLKSLLLPFLLMMGLMAVIAVAKFWLRRAEYQNTLGHQIWPTEIPSVTIASDSGDASLPTVLFIGDSRMAQWHLPKLTNFYAVNAGTGGFTSGQTAMVTPGLLEKFHPKIVVLEVGINDLKYLGLKPEMRTTLVSLVLSNVTTIAKSCEQEHCKLIILETWPATAPDWERSFIWSKVIDASVQEFNTALQTLNAPDKNIHVIDLFKQSGLNPTSDMYSDTLHFKPETYERLNPSLKNILNNP